MISKIIHYCWFGKQPLPEKLRKCVDSWGKYLPDYEFVEWNEERFNVESTAWTKQAYSLGKYAFVSDYVRLKALYEYGGIYLDTDVEVVKRFDSFLAHEAFGGFETQNTITTGVIGASKGNPIIKQFLDSYEHTSFILPDGTLNNNSNVLRFTSILQEYGLTLNNKRQNVGGFEIYPKTYFCPLDVWHYKDITENTYAIHYFEGSWLDEKTKKRIKKESKSCYKAYVWLKGRIGRIYHILLKDRS